MCHTRNCSTPGTRRPVLELRPRKDRSGPRLRFRDEVNLCEECAAAATVETFLSPEGFDKICKHLRESGKKATPRKYVALLWEGTGPVILGAKIEVAGSEDASGSDEELPF